MNLKFETSFWVMPKDCNAYYPMIFGGAFFSEMDICAASCVKRLLHDSECDSAVTYKFEGTFHAAAQAGDLVLLEAEIVELRNKAITISVKGYRDSKEQKELLASARFVFVTKKDGQFHPHGLKLCM